MTDDINFYFFNIYTLSKSNECLRLKIWNVMFCKDAETQVFYYNMIKDLEGFTCIILFSKQYDINISISSSTKFVSSVNINMVSCHGSWNEKKYVGWLLLFHSNFNQERIQLTFTKYTQSMLFCLVLMHKRHSCKF